MADIIDYSKLNEHARKFSKETQALLLQSLVRYNIDDSGYLELSIKSNVGYDFGIASKISYKFLERGVFVEKGVGRGYPIESAKGNAAIAKSGSGTGRVAKPWFNSVIDKEVKRLADILQEDIVEIAVESIRIR